MYYYSPENTLLYYHPKIQIFVEKYKFCINNTTVLLLGGAKTLWPFICLKSLENFLSAIIIFMNKIMKDLNSKKALVSFEVTDNCFIFVILVLDSLFKIFAF